MTRVLLARHGETDHNKDGLIQGQLDIALNGTGVQQAERLAERLADEDVDAVYASELQRSRRTAEIVAEEHDVDVTSLAALNERDYGNLEGEPKDVRQQEIERTGSPWHAWTPDGGEHLTDVAHRTVPALEEIRDRHKGGTVVVVAHSAVNKAVLATLIGADSGHGHVIEQDNTCINELQYEDYRGWRICRINDAQHLEE